jgi:hypothetical protein
MDRQIKDLTCRLIDTELEKIAKNPALNDAMLDNLNKLVVTKEKLLRIEQIEKENEGNMMGMMGGNSMRGNSYDRMPMSFDMGGNSNRMIPMSFDGNGGNGGYSRDDSYSHLEAALRMARDEQEREEIRKLMNRYHN